MKTQEKTIASFFKYLQSFLLFLFISAIIAVSMSYSFSVDEGMGISDYFRENISLIFLLANLFFIPVFLAKRKKNHLLAVLAVPLALSALLYSLSLVFPHRGLVTPSPAAEQDRFYESGQTLLFVEKVEKGKLEGVLLQKNPESPEKRKAQAYRGSFTVTPDARLKLGERDDFFTVEKTGIFRRFFAFLVSNSSEIAASIGKSGISEVPQGLIKSAAVLFSLTFIAFYFSGGALPILNYIISQPLVFLFLYLNRHLQRIRIPVKGIGEAGSFFTSEQLVYYLAGLIISVALILLVSLRRAFKK